jgi:hypothetical protein
VEDPNVEATGRVLFIVTVLQNRGKGLLSTGRVPLAFTSAFFWKT